MPIQDKRRLFRSTLAVFLRSLLILFVILIMAAAGLYLGRNRLIRQGITKGGTQALGVETRVDSVGLNVSGGALGLAGLTVANPAGFKDTPFLQVRHVEAVIEKKTVLRAPVHIRKLRLHGVSLYLEKKNSEANFETILAHIQKEDEARRDATVKKRASVVVDTLILEDINVSAALLPLGGNLTRCHYHIDKIVLKHLGTDREQGLTTDEIFGLVTKALFSSALQLGGKVLPGPIRDGLNRALTPVWNLGELGIEVLAFTVGGVVDVAGFMGKGVISFGKGIKDGVVAVGRAIVPGGGKDSLQTQVPKEGK